MITIPLPEEFKVTAIPASQYVIDRAGENATKDAKNELAAEYVAENVKPGKKYQLKRDWTNPVDPMAVSVHEPDSSVQIGHLVAEDALLRDAFPFSDEDKEGCVDCFVTRKDGNRTFHVEVPGAKPTLEMPDWDKCDLFPPLPLNLQWPRPKDEEQSLMAYRQGGLASPVTAENVVQWVTAAEIYMNASKPMLCLPYRMEMRYVESQVDMALKHVGDWNINDETTQRLRGLRDLITKVVSDRRTVSGENYLGVLRGQLDRLRDEASRPGGLLHNYRAEYLTTEVDRDILQRHREQLTQWIKNLPFKPSINLPTDTAHLVDAHAKKLAYAKMTRTDIYHLLYAWLLLELLPKEKNNTPDAPPSWEECIPEYLRSGIMCEIWIKLKKSGLLTEDYQLAKGVSKSAAKYIAESMCHKKKSKRNEWKPFEKLWGLKDLLHAGTDFNKEQEEIISKIFRDA